MRRERPSSAPPCFCRTIGEDDPVQEEGWPILAKPRAIVLAHAVERIVFAGEAVDESRPVQAIVSRQHSDYVATKGCSDPSSLRHSTEGGGAGLGSSGVLSCSRPPSSPARPDNAAALRAIDEAIMMVQATAQEGAQEAAQARATAGSATRGRGARAIGRGKARGRGRAQGQSTIPAQGAAQPAANQGDVTSVTPPASDPALLIGRGPGVRSTQGLVRLQVEATQPDQRVQEVLSFCGISSAAWSLGELAASSHEEERGAASVARSMIAAGEPSHAPRVRVSLSIEGKWRARAMAASSSGQPVARPSIAPRGAIQRRQRKAVVLGSPSERRVRPSGVRREEDNEEERHLREVKGLLGQIPERFHGGVFRRAMEERGGEGSSFSEVPLAVQEATLAMVLRKKQGSVYGAACALHHFTEWARRKKLGDGLPSDLPRTLWYLHDTTVEARMAAEARVERALAKGEEPAYGRGGDSAAANRRAGLQFCHDFCAVPIECKDSFARALVAFSSAGRRSALFIPPVYLFHCEYLSNHHPMRTVRVGAAARWVKIVAGLRTQDARRSSMPQIGAQVTSAAGGSHLELHGVARRTKTSRGAPTPWWCPVVPLAEACGVRIDELRESLHSDADFFIEATVDATGEPCGMTHPEARFGRRPASSKEITAGDVEIARLPPLCLGYDVTRHFLDHSGRHTMAEVGRAMALIRARRRELSRWRSRTRAAQGALQENEYSRRVGAPLAYVAAAVAVLEHMARCARAAGGWQNLPRSHDLTAYSVESTQAASDAEGSATSSDEDSSGED